jgi:hypothetical protein
MKGRKEKERRKEGERERKKERHLACIFLCAASHKGCFGVATSCTKAENDLNPQRLVVGCNHAE